LQDITDSIWRHSESLDLIEISWLQISDSGFGSIDFRLYMRELVLNLLPP
jgi:hypothetical protein